jgi:hypothetical protein
MIEEKLMKTKMFLVTRATGGPEVFSGTNDPVKDPTGREPIGLREFVERNNDRVQNQASNTRRDSGKNMTPRMQHRLSGG